MTIVDKLLLEKVPGGMQRVGHIRKLVTALC